MAEEQSKAQAGAKALSEPVRVGGSAAEATLSGGELAWRPTGGGGGGGEAGRLELESEVLGVRVDGRALRVATFARGDDAAAAAARPATCGGGERRREREREREVVVEMESEEAAAAWGDAMRDRLASLGKFTD
jgi:sphingosine kinase